jgi:hypothetical protein
VRVVTLRADVPGAASPDGSRRCRQVLARQETLGQEAAGQYAHRGAGEVQTLEGSEIPREDDGRIERCVCPDAGRNTRKAREGRKGTAGKPIGMLRHAFQYSEGMATP